MNTVVELKSPERSPIVPAQDIGEAVHNMLERGWTRLEYPSISRRFEQLVSSFIAMIGDEMRDQYVITDTRELDTDGEPDLGLIFKAKGQVKPRPRPDEIAEGRLRYDSTKAVHHYNPRLLAYLGRTPGVLEKHAEFFLESARLHASTVLLVIELAEEMDRRMPGYGFADRVRMMEWEHKSRLLHYECDGPTQEIATRHRDKCFITPHARSSRGGLWLVDNRDTIVPDAEETRANSVLLFFSRQAWEITRGKLKGIVHGVKDTTFNDLVGRTPRQTLVSFVKAHTTEEDRAWAKDNMSQLNIPAHVDRFANT